MSDLTRTLATLMATVNTAVDERGDEMTDSEFGYCNGYRSALQDVAREAGISPSEILLRCNAREEAEPQRTD